ncbi:class I glutamine amidotransferase-like protein [Bipolaris maydis]|nr:class I glutamine amidotransferase-like protein [Bipolaris maydis]KAJ6275861.1 class I glutamine amidotransferase-like protein [Bipolaris maydis]KAJ6287011.1 class I glutamine amidotransferase-like protein [Bipolaris maydis]
MGFLQGLVPLFGVQLTMVATASGANVPKTYGFVLFRMFDMLDLYGPSEVLQFIGGSYPTNIVYIAETLDPVTTRPALAAMNPLNSSVYPSITPTHTFETAPDLDVLVIPGGPGWRNPTTLNATMEYVRKTTPKVQQVLTICTGSALAARSGILNGKRATSNKSSWLSTVQNNPNTTWVPHARWVEDNSSSPPIWSSSGVTAGIDMMLHWVEKTYNAENATNIARFIEHVRITDPSIDPFGRNETVSG